MESSSSAIAQEEAKAFGPPCQGVKIGSPAGGGEKASVYGSSMNVALVKVTAALMSPLAARSAAANMTMESPSQFGTQRFQALSKAGASGPSRSSGGWSDVQGEALYGLQQTFMSPNIPATTFRRGFFIITRSTFTSDLRGRKGTRRNAESHSWAPAAGRHEPLHPQTRH